MADASIRSTISVAILTTALTLFGTSLQQAHQDKRADSLRFIDGAQTTIQETILVLDDGYNALENLVSKAEEDGWDEFSRSDWREYIDFNRRWRQRLISQHFKLARYFGKDLADNLIHLEEAYLMNQNLKEDKIGTSKPENNYDIQKLASEVELTTRLITVNQDIIDKSINTKKTDDVFDAMEDKRRNLHAARQMLAQYDRGSIMFIKQLDERLTQLGATKVLVVSE